MNDTVAIMWDCNGLEAVVNVSSIEKARTWAALKGEDLRNLPVSPNLLHWRLRAQANPQRHYEIYIISVDEGITADDIREAFEANPQTMADTVRRIGHRFYSDRYDNDEVKIR